MKSLDEYRKEIEKDPAARRKLRKLEKEFSEVEENLTDEELVKYGLKPAEEPEDSKDFDDSGNKKAEDVLDIISRKI